MTYRKQTTPKLFYGKWPYKIECRCAGSWMIKRRGISETRDFCASNDTVGYGYRRETVDKPRLLNFLNNVESYLDQEDVQVRSEHSTFNIYCKDTDLYNSILGKMSGYVSTVFEPSTAQELEYMIQNSHKKVLCNHLPYEKFKYRLYFRPDCDSNVKRSFSSWVTNYTDKVKITNNTFKWFSSGWRQGPYIYVMDQATLSMMGLFLGNNVQKVEEFIPRSSINIILDQDNVCQHLASD